MTRTDVRVLREEILNDLARPDEWSEEQSAPGLARAFLWLLLATSVLVSLMLLYKAEQQQLAQVSAPDVPPAAVPASSGTSTHSLTPPDASTVGGPVKPGVTEALPGEVPPTLDSLIVADPALPAGAAEVGVIEAMLANGTGLSPEKALERLLHLAEDPDPVVREAAMRAAAPLQEARNARSRLAVSACVERANALADAGLFDRAQAALEPPADAVLTPRGLADLGLARVRLAERLAEERIRLFESLEPGLEQGDDGAQRRLATLLAHPYAPFREEAQTVQARAAETRAQRREAERVEESRRRDAIVAFIREWDAAVLAGETAKARKLCSPPSDHPLASAAGSETSALLTGFANDAQEIHRLRATALETNANSRREVTLWLQKKKLSGRLAGVERNTLRLDVGSGVVIGIRPDELTSAALRVLLSENDLDGRRLHAALWALDAIEDPAQASTRMERAWRAAGQPFPLHWALRFKHEAIRTLEQTGAERVRELEAALGRNNAAEIRAALIGAREILVALDGQAALPRAWRNHLDLAEARLRAVSASRVVLQSGVSPTEEYFGLVTDQISEYRESRRLTDAGVQYGLKAGAAGGLHRILIRFDGLEGAVGRGRVRKATLELYQLESRQSRGAELSLYRLAKAWVPDAGSWMCFDTAGNKHWDAPGASGPADCGEGVEASVSVDGTQAAWRSWDVTRYVDDVLAGRQPNHGLLLKVVRDEPSFDVRFYPETDLSARKDTSLRPRLVLELEGESTPQTPTPTLNATERK